MKLEYLIFPYWFVFAAWVGGAIYIHKFKIIPTLKKYGRDYEEYLSLRKQRKQLDEYIELCKEHRLPDIHWRYMRIFNKVGLVLLIGWVLLLYLAEQQ